MGCTWQKHPSSLLFPWKDGQVQPGKEVELAEEDLHCNEKPALTEWHEQGPVWTLNSVDRHHMYCVVVVHISYDNRLRTGRYEVTTQRQCAHCRAALEQTPRGVTEKTTGGVWLSDANLWLFHGLLLFHPPLYSLPHKTPHNINAVLFKLATSFVFL